MDMIFAAKFFGALFAVMNPFLTLPIFLTMTTDSSLKQQQGIVIHIVLYAGVMCAVVAFSGNHVLSFFGVSIDHFRVAGGLVLIGIAFSMLNGNESSSHTGSDQEKEHLVNDDIAFYPMTFPMIVGPGTITTLVLYAYQANSIEQYAAYGVVVLGVLAIMFLVLFFAPSIGHIMSSKMRIIMTRIMGMLLAAISVSMVVTGLNALMPGLAGT